MYKSSSPKCVTDTKQSMKPAVHWYQSYPNMRNTSVNRSMD